MEPLISIVIPTYNEEKDIEDCLNSLKNQSYQNFEIIVVDDGSTDNTLEIVKKYSEVKIFRQTHKGPGDARNLGSKDARGEILIFIDSDMTFEKNYLANLIKPILIEDAIGTTHDYEIATNISNKYSYLWGEVRVSKEDAKDVRIFRAIKKDKFYELGGFDAKYGYADDQTFWFKYRLKPVVAKDTICYHKNPESLRGTYRQARWIGASWSERFKIFQYPILGHICVLLLFIFAPVVSLIKSFTGRKKKISFLDRFFFYNYKFYGYCSGIFRSIFLGINYK